VRFVCAKHNDLVIFFRIRVFDIDINVVWYLHYSLTLSINRAFI